MLSSLYLTLITPQKVQVMEYLQHTKKYIPPPIMRTHNINFIELDLYEVFSNRRVSTTKVITFVDRNLDQSRVELDH